MSFSLYYHQSHEVKVTHDVKWRNSCLLLNEMNVISIHVIFHFTPINHMKSKTHMNTNHINLISLKTRSTPRNVMRIKSLDTHKEYVTSHGWTSTHIYIHKYMFWNVKFHTHKECVKSHEWKRHGHLTTSMWFELIHRARLSCIYDQFELYICMSSHQHRLIDTWKRPTHDLYEAYTRLKRALCTLKRALQTVKRAL